MAQEEQKALFLGELKTEEDLKKELESLALQPEKSTELTPSTIENIEGMKEKDRDLQKTEEEVEEEKTLSQEDTPNSSLETEEAPEKEQQQVKLYVEEGLSEEQKDEALTSESDAASTETEETREVDQSKEDPSAVEELTKKKQGVEKGESQPAPKLENNSSEKQLDCNEEKTVKPQSEKGKFTWVVKQPDGIEEEKEESDSDPKEEN